MKDLKCKDSSLIEKISYDEARRHLTVHFKKYYVDQLTYEGVDLQTVAKFLIAPSAGRFYLHNIKKQFALNSEDMPDKIIKIKIDTRKINKDWLFVGEKGTYLNVTMLYNESEDQHGNNGMIVQDVPKAIYEKDKSVRGPILGNGKRFGSGLSAEQKPGMENGKMMADLPNANLADDLPF